VAPVVDAAVAAADPAGLLTGPIEISEGGSLGTSSFIVGLL
jgi:hypothetical protein